MRVVDALEAVQVEQHGAERVAIALRAADLVVEEDVGPAPVAEVGQRIVLGLV